MSDEEDFKEQLRQEELEKTIKDDVSDSRTRVDPDGTVYEWDSLQKAWFPKIDADFIAKYQMNYGSEVTSSDTKTDESESSVVAPKSGDPQYDNYYYTGSTDGTVDTNSKEYAEWYQTYFGTHTEEKTIEKKSDSVTGKGDAKTKETDEKNSEMKVTAAEKTDKSGIPAAPEDVNSEEYYNWYYTYHGGGYTKPDDEPTNDEYDEYWQQYLNQAKAEEEEYEDEDEEDGKKKNKNRKDNKQVKDSEKDSKDNKNDDNEKGKGKGKRKMAPVKEPPSWFDVTEDKNTNVYVSGLPSDITDDEFTELMKKCGLVMFDPITRKSKLKLYKDEEGKNKGDARCCYIKPESVELALQIIDGSELRGQTISVERAKFELKGTFDPKKRRRKLTKNEKKKFQDKQERLFDWHPDKPFGTRNKWERTVILKNVFAAKKITTEQVIALREDLKKECARYGEVTKVKIYDRHVDGVVGVTFKEHDDADICVEAMNGRFFKQRPITAITHDGKTKYHIEETEEQQKERIKEWDTFLADGNPEVKTHQNPDGNSQPGTSDNSHSSDGGVRNESNNEGTGSNMASSEAMDTGESSSAGGTVPESESEIIPNINEVPNVALDTGEPSGADTASENETVAVANRVNEEINPGEPASAETVAEYETETIPEGAAASGGEGDAE